MTDAKLKSLVERVKDLIEQQIALTELVSEAERGIIAELGLATCKTYVMRAGERGLVKIGKAANVERRRKELQTGCPVRLKVLRVIHFDCERRMHERFAHVWKSGEWFEFDLDMLTESFNEDLLALAEAA